jgi:DDE superfamily endonuclease/Winged helix-turn helix
MRGPPVCLRDLTPEERSAVAALARSRTAPARRVERARVVWHVGRGEAPPAIAGALGVDAETVRRRIRRFNAEGLAALEDHPRRASRDLLGQRGCDGDRHCAHRAAEPGPAVRLVDAGPPGGLAARAQGRRDAAQPDRRDPAQGGPALAPPRDLVRRARGSRVRGKKGRIETLYTAPPGGSVVVCLDEMGPLSAKSYPGREPVRTQPPPAGRARQEIDYGRRGKGYVFGAFRPATGAAFTQPYPGRGTGNRVAFLDQLEEWVPAGVERIYAIADNLGTHRAPDVLLFMLAHPRWEMVLQPKYAAYLNLIEPWWKVLRALALAGRRFETWDEVWEAVDQAAAYWNAHRRPFVWGRRRRHRPRREPGIAVLPKAA